MLIVEDNPVDREVYRRLMTRDADCEYRFTETELGEDGIDVCLTNPPDCVLLDYNLPDFDGLEFLTTLSERISDITFPVVMLTGQGDERVAVEALKYGAEDYLVKAGLTPELLRRAVSNAVEKMALRRSVKINQEELARIATTDALTDIPNRRYLMERLTQELERAKRYETPLSVLLLDLDYFKQVNDRYGHLTGDEVLKSVGKLLEQCARQTDIVGRYGGEEFCVVLTNTALEEAAQVAQRICERARDECHHPVESKGEFHVTCSIGAAGFDDDASDAASFLARADTALYNAKDQGRDRIRVYRRGDAELTKRQMELQWVSKINQALSEGRFCLNVQPIVPVAPGEWEGEHYEVLLRMRDEDGEIVSPGEFLPAAEQFHLSTKLDRWVTSTVFAWLADHSERLRRLHLCAINLSGQSVTDQGLLEFIIEQLHARHIPARKICFEITETAAIENLSEATKFITTLRSLGCRFALDDFGSGLSSFTYLKSLPVDYLKIDGAFVRGIADDPIDFAVVRTINEIGKVMNKQTIAEFVENQAIREKLQEIGVDYAQGYGIGRPEPIEEATCFQFHDDHHESMSSVIPLHPSTRPALVSSSTNH